MKISINEPCHENWDAMTANAQGAFCKSCAKDVVDFSKMGIAEIKSFFSKPQGKVCGRFEEKQLQELTFDDFFAKFTYWNFAKKFAVIFFLAFGCWIFSNSSAMAQNEKYMMKGDVAYVPEKKTIVKQAPVKNEEPSICEKTIKMGKVRTIRQEEKKEPMIMGDIGPMPEEIKKSEPIIKGDVAVTTKEEKILPICVMEKNPEEAINVNYVLGQTIVQKPVQKTEVIKTEPMMSIDSLTTRTEKIKDNIHQMTIYPNPTNGNFTLETDVTTKQVISMYDENGKLVMIKSITGTSTIDASGLNNGIYNMIITGGPTDGLLKKRVVIVK